jgi:cell division transport system ATP-binding protein
MNILETIKNLIKIPTNELGENDIQPFSLPLPKASGYTGKEMIYFDNVSKLYYDGTPALEDVTVKIAPKEFVSVVGHSGAGKTTLLKMLLAEDTPTQGTVFFEDIDVHSLPKSSLHKYRRKIGMVFQDFRLIPNKTAYENIAFAMEAAGREDEEIAVDVPYILDLVDLAKKGSHFPHQLSGGEQQRVAIGRAIVNQPDLIVADEPTGNLDPVNTYEIVEILKKINELGTTILITTHNKGVVDAIGKRVITMDSGRIARDDMHGQYTL